MRILLLYADATQTLPVARSLRQKGHFVAGVFASRLSYGYPSRFINKRYLFSNVENVDEYYGYVYEILEHTEYDSIIPMNDASAVMLSKYSSELRQFTAFVMPDYKTFSRAYDKHSLMRLCQEKGYPHPRTTIVEDGHIEQIDVDSLQFPLLIKPNLTCGARGMTYCEDKNELLGKFPSIYREYGDCHLQSFVPVGGHQVEVQLYINEKQKLIQSSVIKKFRWYPENGGSSCCNTSDENDKIVGICCQILKDIGWVGFADFDTIEDPRTGELLIMEINPRLPACVKTPFAAGIDWADVIVSEYLGNPHRCYQASKQVYLRHLGFETLWFFYSKNRFKTTPNWFKFIGRNIFYQDISCFSDPLPFFFGTLGNVIKQLSPKFRKTKSGTR
ncbi:MAG: ATP-grasp domain-containing protein [Salinivirgaceae bacterium]|nr:ATP-grasp domain-containing protein [Salinivirgaceae bacterium]